MECPHCGEEFEFEYEYQCPHCGAELEEADIICECPFCDAELYWEERIDECPFCGADTGEAVLYCPYCESYIDWEGNEWECEECGNEGKSVVETLEVTFEERESPHCPECGAEMDDDGYCDVCGWPNNQGWIGENY